MPLLYLRRREQLEFRLLRTRLCENVTELIHPVGGVREANAAGQMVVDVVTGLVREARIERGGIALQLEDAPGGREVGAVAGGMPGGSRGELIALEQHRIGPAELSQMVQRAAANSPSADHHDPSLALHRRAPWWAARHLGAVRPRAAARLTASPVRLPDRRKAATTAARECARRRPRSRSGPRRSTRASPARHDWRGNRDRAGHRACGQT